MVGRWKKKIQINKKLKIMYKQLEKTINLDIQIFYKILSKLTSKKVSRVFYYQCFENSWWGRFFVEFEKNNFIDREFDDISLYCDPIFEQIFEPIKNNYYNSTSQLESKYPDFPTHVKAIYNVKSNDVEYIFESKKLLDAHRSMFGDSHNGEEVYDDWFIEMGGIIDSHQTFEIPEGMEQIILTEHEDVYDDQGRLIQIKSLFKPKLVLIDKDTTSDLTIN